MQFKPDKPSSNIEKQNIWNEWSKKVEKITDRIGYPIDPGIKESVIALNVFGIKTDGSCEGHLDRGLPYPWVDIEFVTKEDLIAKFPNYKNDLEIIKEKQYGSIEMMQRNNPTLYERMRLIENYLEETKKKSEKEILELLDEFYTFHKPYSKEGKIKANERNSSGFRIELSSSRGLGLDNWKKYDEKIAKLSPQEKELYLKNNQAEMKAFTEFLKNKFLNEK